MSGMDHYVFGGMCSIGKKKEDGLARKKIENSLHKEKKLCNVHGGGEVKERKCLTKKRKENVLEKTHKNTMKMSQLDKRIVQK